MIAALAAIGLLLLSQQPGGQQIMIIPEPVKGGTYTEALVGNPARLNPTLDYVNAVDRDIDRLIFSGLIKFNDRGIAQADLAESWGISKDGTSYNFALRKNALWHDGQPVTSDDILFTVELLRHPDYPVANDLRDMWKTIEVKRLDEQTLQFRLPEPFSPFLDYLTFGILPKHILGSITPKEIVDAPFNLAPVGSGPYRFSRMLTQTDAQGKVQIGGIELNAFDKYYSHPAYIDQIIFRFYPDSLSALAAYQARQVQGIGNITSDILAQALVEQNLSLYTSRLPRQTMILLNLNNPEVPFFKESKIRQALMMGINRQKIIDRILNGQAIIATSPIFPGTWAFFDGIQTVEYDPDKAVSLLKAEGYVLPASGSTRAKENQALTFEVIYVDNPTNKAIAESIQQNWTDLQINVTLKPIKSEEILPNYLEPRRYQAALVQLDLTRSPDPDPYPFWHQAQATGGQNYSQWEDRQSSEYLEEARVTIDPEERGRLYRNFQVRFASELPALPLYYLVYTYGVDAEVQGIRLGPLFDSSDRFSMVVDWFLIAKGKVAATIAP